MANHAKTDHERTTRLAEGEFAIVDMCNCGSLQLHLGDLTLRLSPDVVRGLMRTLGAALAQREALLNERAAADFIGGGWSSPESQRGKA